MRLSWLALESSGLRLETQVRTVEAQRMTNVILRSFRAGDVDWLTDAHQTLYTRDEGFDASFGPLVRDILEGFVQSQDPVCEQGWIAEAESQPLGSIFCVRGDETTARLRLFLVLPEARGRGIGQHLLNTCMGFAQDAGYRGMTLWTHESHKAACAQYRKAGWRIAASKPVRSFGVDLVEQSWAIEFQ